MQSFLEDGNLTPGIHEYSFCSLKKQFVQNFIISQTRKQIYENFLEWLTEIVSVCPPHSIWIDGSFVTTKIDPNDIDVVLLYSPEDIQNEKLATQLGKLISSSKNHQCDAYFCYTLASLCDEEKERFPNDFHIMEHYWKGFFSYDRNRRPKGMIEIIRKELLSLLEVN